MFRRHGVFAICLFGAFLPAVSQQANPPLQDSGEKSGAAASPTQSQAQSLGDIARRLRKDTTTNVKMTDSDAKKLFESVDRIFAFAAQDSEMPKRAVVKRQLVTKADVEKFTRDRLAKEEYTQRFTQAELSMKKLGFLPRDFNLREFLVKANGANVAGYYDEETKTISLLDWIPPEQQEAILAHELTHALQDQNYGLKKWMKAGLKPEDKASKGESDDDSGTARKAVIEGQAMVVFVDYTLAPIGHNLADSPGLLYQMEDPAVKAVADSQMLHDAPMILRESGTFAYNEGLIFEGELLQKGGRKMAFAGVFARPPQNSHEVLQPEAYINREKLEPVHIPDMHALLNNQYDVYDSGGIGELDVRALLKQYGERKIAADLAAAWQGGAYVTYRRANKDAIAPATRDLAVLYVSRWKSAQAAERFAQFYTTAVSQRYRSPAPAAQPACAGANCPVSSAQIATEEGPVIVEHWADNTVVVSESFDPATAAKLSGAVRDGGNGVHAQNLRADDDNEIGLRLFEIPAFREFQAAIGQRIAQEMLSNAGR
jgi:hypothetical protein